MVWERRVARGVWKFRTLVGRRLVRYAVAEIASGQKCAGVLASNIRARMITRSVRFFLSATPFGYGVYGQEVW